MIEAALIISVISLMLSMASITWLLAKHLSSHTIQMVPLEQELPNLGLGGTKPTSPLMDMYQEFDAPRPLDPSEEAYFNQFNKPKKQA